MLDRIQVTDVLDWNKVFIWRQYDLSPDSKKEENERSFEKWNKTIEMKINVERIIFPKKIAKTSCWHHKLGKSWMSNEQSPKVVRSKSSIASTSRSKVELGNEQFWPAEGKSRSMFGDPISDIDVEFDDNGSNRTEFADGQDDELGIELFVVETLLDVGFFRSTVDFDLFIWWRIMARTIRRNNGLDRSIVFSCLLNFDEIIWSNS